MPRRAPTSGTTRVRTVSFPTSTSRWGRPPRTSRLLTGISREDQDHWGVRSQNRAEEAINSGFFAREISPVTLPDGSKVSTDDGPRAGTTYEKISQLKPVFRPNGTVTAGNACPLNDGAASVIVRVRRRPRSSA